MLFFESVLGYLCYLDVFCITPPIVQSSSCLISTLCKGCTYPQIHKQPVSHHSQLLAGQASHAPVSCGYHRMVQVGRVLKEYLVQTPLLWVETPSSRPVCSEPPTWLWTLPVSLDNLFHYLTTLTVNNFLFISNLSFPSSILKPLMLLHSLLKIPPHLSYGPPLSIGRP